MLASEVMVTGLGVGEEGRGRQNVKPYLAERCQCWPLKSQQLEDEWESGGMSNLTWQNVINVGLRGHGDQRTSASPMVGQTLPGRTSSALASEVAETGVHVGVRREVT